MSCKKRFGQSANTVSSILVKPINHLLCEMLGGLPRGSAVIFGTVVIDGDIALTTVNDKLVRLFKSKYKHFISPWEVFAQNSM